MQRTDSKVIADHETRIATRKQLERELRKGGLRPIGRSPLTAFAAGSSSKAKIKAAAKAAKGRGQ